MSTTPRQHKDDIRKFIQSMGQCTPSAIHNLFDAKSDISKEIRLVAAVTAICSIDPVATGPKEHWQCPLDALVQDNHPMCGAAIQYIAEHAQNLRIRVEAIRRVGAVASDTTARSLLHSVAREGLSPGTSYSHGDVSKEHFQVAALESIRKLPKPCADDSECVIAVVNKEIEAQRPTEVFRAGVETLAMIALSSDVKQVVHAIEVVRDNAMALQLLSILARFPKATLLTHRKSLAKRLGDALAAFRDEAPLRERLAKLAASISCAELLQRLPDYSNDGLEGGRGAISAAAINAYQANDVHLVATCLGFLRSDNNLRSGNPCIAGLRRCVEAGEVQLLAKALGPAIPHYEGLVRSGLLVEVFGEVSNVVGAFSGWIDAIQDPHSKAHCSATCFVGIVNASLVGSTGYRCERTLDNVREQAAQGHRGPVQTINAVAELLENLSSENDPLCILADTIVSPKGSNGVVALAEQALASNDELAHSFLEKVLRQAAHIHLDPGELIKQDSCLNKCEGHILPKHHAWLRVHLPRLLLCDGKVNRYAVYFGMREKLIDVATVENLLAQVSTAQDGDFLVCTLAFQETTEGFAAAARAVDFASDKPFCAEVRKSAIERIEYFSGHYRSNETVVSRLHARFQDIPSVRLAAYRACGAVGSYSSIMPLKERLASEAEKKGKEGIAAALVAIRERLSKEQPPLNEPRSLVTWLEHVGNLGDHTLLPSVGKFLSVPHSDSAVTIEALRCLGKLGNKESLGAIDKYVTQTSAAGEILKAARQAKLLLQERNDLEFFEVLSKIFEADSPVLDPSLNYEAIFGSSRVGRLSSALAKALEQREVNHWDDFVTCLDGVCDVLIRHVFEACWSAMKLEEAKGLVLAKKEYANRLEITAFKNTFPSIQPLLLSIHQMRKDATTAHVEEADGGEKPGLQASDADLALKQFRKMFPEYVATLRACTSKTIT